ncbi:BamA/TamA family outer membrane protein [Roseivirga sp. BDSF3-8]|uniref:translocation and assembly module lipoprotein TamL n=1 Tax=Roseivirga sp. BDSF3-8 TaxID=3241598 RepID=UPI003532171E
MNLAVLFETMVPSRIATKIMVRVFFWAFIPLFLSGCLGTKYLDENEVLLRKQQIEGNEELSATTMESYYQQETNRQILFFPVYPYVYLYHWGLNNYDKTEIRADKEDKMVEINAKIEEAKAEDKENKVERLERKKERKEEKFDKKLREGNILMRWGEPLAVLDTGAVRTTTEQLRLLMSSRGYLNSEADFNIDVEDKKAYVTYNVEEKTAWTIDTFQFRTDDEAIRELISGTLEESPIQQGENYETRDLDAERQRVDELLKNNGFYDFSRQYLVFNVDTTVDDHKAWVEMVVQKPRSGTHKRYKLDSVIFVTDASESGEEEARKVKQYQGVTYKYYDDIYSRKILDRRLFIYPDSFYSKQNTFETQRQLANLDMFKFININYDTTGGRFVANIFTSPLKSYQTSNEVGVNVSQGLPGPFYNLSFKKRNVFGGLEILELNGRIAAEGVASFSDPENVYQSREYSANLSLIFPQFIFPFSDNFQRKIGEYNPKTRVQTGYSFTNRPEYERSNLNAALVYTWQKDTKIFYNLTLADLSVIRTPRTTEAFDSLLLTLFENGNNLINSFNSAFVSSVSFSPTFSFNNYGDYEQKASYLKLFVESGGTTLNLYKPRFLKSEQMDSTGLDFYQWVKFFADYRQNIPLNQNQSFAWRINAGAAKPYGRNEALPYEKYFFAGGSNSVRAWRPRRLGPGSYTPRLADGSRDYQSLFEQPGEIIFVASAEFRRKIIGFLNGAVFVDAGNVWTISEDRSRPGADFSLTDFYQEMAIGTGIGFRFDFSFLILRLDIATKVRDPAIEEGSKWLFRPFGDREETVLNIGIGYPF